MDMSLATRGLCVLPALLAAVVTVQAQTVLPPAQPADWAAPTGRFRVVMEEAETLANHTIYRPENLGQLAAGRRLPVVAFAGPGCDANGTAFRPFFTEVASHGFFVLVSGLPEPRGGSGPNYPKTAPSDLVASIDWAVAENGRAGSPYAGRIDSDRIAVMGQSCGGAQSLSIASDPRIDTIVLWNSTSFIDGPTGRGRAGGGRAAGQATGAGQTTSGGAAAAPAGAARAGRAGRGGIPVPAVDPTVLQQLRVPVAYFIGGEKDILYGGAVADIARFDAAPLFWASVNLSGPDPHAGTFREKNGGAFGVVGVAWLKWHLRGDSQAARLFEGPACTLCTDPAWDVRKRNLN
jgi:dienelactone hydrolase